MTGIRCSVCGEVKPESSFPKNRTMDGTIKVTGDVCCTCVSRKYRQKTKETNEKLKKIKEVESITMLEMVAKLNSLGYIIVKKDNTEQEFNENDLELKED